MKLKLLMITTALLLAGFIFKPYSIQELYEDKQPATVKIITVIIAEGEYKMYHGSGFLISEDGQVATAAHVVYDYDTETYARFIILSNDKKDYFKADILKLDLKHDIAVLQIKQELRMNKLTPKNISIQSQQESKRKFSYLSLTSSKNLKVGDKVYSIGYPTVYYSILSEGIITTNESQLVPNRDTNANYEDVLACSMFTQHGNSGSPVLDTRGRVLGVLTMGLETSPLTLFQRAEYLQELLKDKSSKIIISEKDPFDDDPSLF